MITSLTQLTMRQYIDLVCNDTSVLNPDNEPVTDSQLDELRSELIAEFNKLSNEAATKANLVDKLALVKAKRELMLFRCLNKAILEGGVDDVRSVLKDYGISREMTNKQLSDEVVRRLKRAKTEIKRYESKKTQATQDRELTKNEIRLQFDRLAASLMTHFKVQIDFNTITASSFAYMIDQADKQIKAQLSIMNKK